MAGKCNDAWAVFGVVFFFLVMLVVQVPYFYARAKVPLDAASRGRHYYYNAPWRVYLSQQIALMCLSILFLVWVRNPIWPRVALVIAVLIVGFAAWRFVKILGKPKFKNATAESKTIR